VHKTDGDTQSECNAYNAVSCRYGHNTNELTAYCTAKSKMHKAYIGMHLIEHSKSI